MAKESNDIWKKRIASQRFELIGSTVPGEGNGYHDRISFDLHPSTWREQDKKYDHWLYTVYFRDLRGSFDPQLRNRLNENLDFTLDNCSENYLRTFNKYIAGGGYHYRSEILDLLSNLSKWLIYDGKVILEFVSWLDNENKEFYAFELKHLRFKNIQEKRRYIIYKGQDEGGLIKKVKIPKEKCIVINWPASLGGFKAYQRTVGKILKLGSKLPPMEDVATLEPGKILARGKVWDDQFNRLVAPWGMTNPDKDLTEFYKEYNFLKVRRTGILCMEVIQEGLNQIVKKLNAFLNEDAKVTIKSDYYSIKKYNDISSQWMNGEISFPKANAYLK